MTVIRDDAWPVGILFSRSGLMAIPSSQHIAGATLAIEEVNAAVWADHPVHKEEKSLEQAVASGAMAIFGAMRRLARTFIMQQLPGATTPPFNHANRQNPVNAARHVDNRPAPSSTAPGNWSAPE